MTIFLMLYFTPLTFFFKITGDFYLLFPFRLSFFLPLIKCLPFLIYIIFSQAICWFSSLMVSCASEWPLLPQKCDSLCMEAIEVVGNSQCISSWPRYLFLCVIRLMQILSLAWKTFDQYSFCCYWNIALFSIIFMSVPITKQARNY